MDVNTKGTMIMMLDKVSEDSIKGCAMGANRKYIENVLNDDSHS